MYGEIDENRELKYEFVKFDDTEFTKLEQSVDKCESKEDLVEMINELRLDENQLYEIILVGDRNFEINTRDIFKLIVKPNILKIKDETKLKYNLEEIKYEKTLRGLFVQEMLKKLEDGNTTRNEVEKAIEIGLNSLRE
ncbi:MAG: hypothetical protein IJ629_00745 [Clostridia bacterium]|nr:hypothetical protein [Clostridia bacterium]